MIGRTNVGGGGIASAAWAYIGVTYPEGSTCSATNGVITLTADGTSGLYVFLIPEPEETPETWTVTCTDGVKTRTAEVELSEQYQNETVLIRYSRLPEGYQEVEYLESDGHDQYIDIFHAATNPYAYEIEITYAKLSTKAGSAFGNAQTAGGVTIYGGRLQTTGSEKYDYYFAGLDSNSHSVTEQMNGNVYANDIATVVINDDDNNVVENGITIGSLSDFSGTQGWGRPLLFSIYVTSTGSNNGTTARIYSFIAKNKQSGIVEKNFVPCYRVSDDEAGFYDLANNTFVQNDGFGSFTVGEDV